MMERAVLEYVANSIWQVPLLALTTWLAIRAGRPEPRAQYRMWVGTLALAVVLPLMQPATFDLHLPRSARNQFTAPAHGVSVDASFLYEPMIQSGNIAQAGASVAEDRDASVRADEAKNDATKSPHSVRLSQGAVDWLLGIYFAIVLLRLVQLARSRRAAKWLLRRAKERMLSPLERTALEKCCGKMHVREPRVLFSGEARTPMAIGSLRPALLLPESFHECAEAEMKAILCHELAHVRRGDYLANWICQLGSLPIAYHPATYGIDREIRRSRELTCDAMAAEGMDSSVEYAGCLVGLARRIESESVASRAAGRGSVTTSGSAGAAGLFDHDVFEERIMRLLERTSGSGRTIVWRMTGAFALIAGAAVCAAALHITPVVRADSTSTPASQAAVSVQPMPAQVTSRARIPEVAPVRKHTRVPVRAVIAVKMRAPVKAPAPGQNAMPVVAKIRVRAIVPMVELAEPLKTLVPLMAVHAVSPVQNAMPVVAKIRLRAVVPMAKLAEPLRAVVPLQDVTPVKPAPPLPPLPPSVPKPEPMPPAPSEPATPASPAAPPRPAPSKPPSSVPEHHESMDSEATDSGATVQLTPAQRAQIDREMAAADAQIREQTKVLNSPQFKAQMAQMHRQIEAATKNLRSAEFQAQMKTLQSPEFKKQMADMQAQMQEATKQMRSAEFQAQMKALQSPEFKKQMADMQAQMQEAAKQMRSAEFQAQMKALQSPEFKKQMADMQRQIQEATRQMQSAQFRTQMKYLQSPEFKKQMEDMQRQIREATKNLEINRMQLDMKRMPKPVPLKAGSTSSHDR
jgi:beta-lactamase regulating signal transducer with metallopeptidase domain